MGNLPGEVQERWGGRRLVFLVSYPKSGNTWVRLLLGTYYYARPDAPIGWGDLAVQSFRAVSPIPVQELDMFDQAALRPAAMIGLRSLLAEGRWALVKSHHASADMAGIPMFAATFCDRAIVVVRDPRDVLPSIASHMDKTLEEAADMMGAGDAWLPDPTWRQMPALLGSWSDHVGSWLRQGNVPALITRYEDLHGDTAGTLDKILRYLGEEEVSEERLRIAVEANQFGHLQAREKAGGFDEKPDNESALFFRRGVVGGWRDEVPEALIRRIEADHGHIMERMGYELAFSEEPVTEGVLHGDT